MNRRRTTLLFIDADSSSLEQSRTIFADDYDIFVADNLDAALAVLADHKIPIAIIDSAFRGAGLFEKIADGHPEVVRVIAANAIEVGVALDVIHRGLASCRVKKPWDVVEMASVVSHAVEKHELLAERQRLLLAIEEASNLKEAFVTVISHELNTPLSILLGILDLAVARSSDPKLVDLLRRGQRSARRLQWSLANSFKLLQKNAFERPLDWEMVRCEALFAEIVDELSPHMQQRNQKAVVVVEPADLTVRCSPSHLKDALSNLLANAIKFSPDGASIELTADRDAQDRIVLEVLDHGVGVSWDDQSYIFEPLFGTFDVMHHSSGDFGYCKRGMGIGLTIVKKFVELQGGEVDFDTTPGVGSAFRIYMPNHQTESTNNN